MAHIEDEEIVEKIAKKYGPKIVHLLDDVTDAFKEEGYTVSEPFDRSDEEPAWEIFAKPPTAPEEDSVDVSITIAISEVNDGEANGTSFLLSVVHTGGSIIGGLAPFNYTDRVWVPRDDSDAVEERWAIFEGGVDPTAIVDSVTEWYGRRRSARPRRGDPGRH